MKKLVFSFIVALVLISLFSFAIARESGEREDRPVIKINDDGDLRDRLEAEMKVRLRQANMSDDELKLRVREEMKIRMRDGNLSREEIKGEVERFRERIRTENGSVEIEGRRVKLHSLNDKQIEMIVGKINARTGLNLTADDIGNGTVGSMLRAYLSNGRHAEIKVMPNTASQRALEKLRAKCAERNCTIVLKEVDEDGDDLNESDDGNKTRLAYDIKTDKDARLLWLFKKKMKVEAQVDAETGEVIKARKPWWSIIASEDDATPEEIEEDISGNETVSE